MFPCRTLLAAMHYNENSEREQALTAEGEKQWKMKRSKARKGHRTVCPVMTEPTFGESYTAIVAHNHMLFH